MHSTHRRVAGFAALLAAAALAGTLHSRPVSAQGAVITPPSQRPVDPRAGETKAQRDARMAWWREARFGMFIHWGLYAVPAGVWHGRNTEGEFSGGAGEWIMHDLKIPVAPYAAQAASFNPTKFDAETWVGIAKAAGMKYIVMTAKHHEGFAMYHTGVDKYNIYDATPFKREPIAEMAAACKRAHIKFGVYYSQNLDWHHPGGGTAGPLWDPAQSGSHDAYIKTVAAPQVKELLDRFHPAVLWWDINDTLTPDEARALTAPIADDPSIITNNRLGTGVAGDTETPEQTIPATGYPGRDWETCMTINDTWGYKTDDTDFKPYTTLLTNLIDIASKGGNYLLNVGPDATGTIPQPEVDRLMAMGKWLRVNGDSIYGTTASPFMKLPFDGRATVKGTNLYLNVFTWPGAGLILPGLKTPVKEAHDLATGEKLTATQNSDGTLSISKPSVLDPVSTIIVLKLAGPPVVDNTAFALKPAADGVYTLNAVDADINGSSARLQGSGEGENIGYWTDASNTVDWTIATPAAAGGSYSVTIDNACDPSSAGSTVAVLVDGADTGLSLTVAGTGGWDIFTSTMLTGTLSLTPGKHVLEIKPTNLHGAVMNLRGVMLTPTGK